MGESIAEALFFLVGCFVSVLSVIALWTTWWILPRWRTLDNYVSINHVTMGTIHLVICALMIDGSVLYILIIGFIFLITMAWSLASSLISYFKLVLLNNVKVSNDKLIITMFVYGLTIVVKVLNIIPAKFILGVETIDAAFLGLSPLFFILFLKVALFISVIVSVMSCFKRSISKRKFGHVVALVGVALLCDAGTLIWAFTRLFFDANTLDPFFYNRLIPQAAFMMFSPSSRAHWRRYFRRRRRLNAATAV